MIPWDRVGVLDLGEFENADDWWFTKRFGDEVAVTWHLALVATAAGVHVTGRVADLPQVGA